MIRLLLLLSLISGTVMADPVAVRFAWQYPDESGVSFELFVWPAGEPMPAASPAYTGPGLITPPIEVAPDTEHLARVYAVQDDLRSPPSPSLLFVPTAMQTIRLPTAPAGFRVIWE